MERSNIDLNFNTQEMKWSINKGLWGKGKHENSKSLRLFLEHKANNGIEYPMSSMKDLFIGGLGQLEGGSKDVQLITIVFIV